MGGQTYWVSMEVLLALGRLAGSLVEIHMCTAAADDSDDEPQSVVGT